MQRYIKKAFLKLIVAPKNNSVYLTFLEKVNRIFLQISEVFGL